MNEIMIYTADHRCEPNGVGDYHMVCPAAGVVPGFVPYMMRSTQTICISCGERVRWVANDGGKPSSDLDDQITDLEKSMREILDR